MNFVCLSWLSWFRLQCPVKSTLYVFSNSTLASLFPIRKLPNAVIADLIKKAASASHLLQSARFSKRIAPYQAVNLASFFYYILYNFSFRFLHLPLIKFTHILLQSSPLFSYKLSSVSQVNQLLELHAYLELQKVKDQQDPTAFIGNSVGMWGTTLLA